MMKTYLRLILRKIVSTLCERWDLVLENVALKHQIDVLKRSGRRPQFANADLLVWVFLSTVWPRWPEALEIVNADTVKRWRQQGFRHYLLGKSRRRRPGRPAIEPEIRSLIQHMSRQNVLWGAPRIHGELLKLGVDVCQTTVAKYMVRRVGPPSQRWGTFLRNHVRELVPSELFSRLIRSFRSLITRIAGAVNCWLTGLFCNLLSPPGTTARRIVDEPVSCQSILRLAHQTVTVPVGFASRGPPVVKPLFNKSSPFGTLVAVVCPTPIGYADKYSLRWRKFTQTIHLHHFPHRSDRLAA
ncbi:MAG: hypothetical protein GY768_03130 [Planctomycetaceae bacterium]|nr:hypothetical protein [Planctomycetaceae bacterium]